MFCQYHLLERCKTIPVAFFLQQVHPIFFAIVLGTYYRVVSSSLILLVSAGCLKNLKNLANFFPFWSRRSITKNKKQFFDILRDRTRNLKNLVFRIYFPNCCFPFSFFFSTNSRPSCLTCQLG